MIGILGTGSYLPEHEIGNDDLARRVPRATTEWIERRTHIRTRRYAAPDQAVSDLSRHAAAEALKQAGLVPEQLDYIILSTSTGDSPLPCSAALVQDALGATRAACFDINVACTGFIYGLELARGLLSLRPAGKTLVIGADLWSRFLDYDDRGTAVLLGDGAGAAVLGAVPDSYGILDVELTSRGDVHQLIRIDSGGSRLPASAQTVAEGGHYLRMQGRRVTEFVMDNVPDLIGSLLARAGVSATRINHFVPHQANGALLVDLAQRCGLAGATTHMPLVRYGNIGSASIPVALDEAARSGVLADGDVLLLAGFGAGMAVGACLLRWSTRSGEQ